MFVDSLRSYVVVAFDFDIAIGGASLADSICSYHYPNPLHPVPGPSQRGDSILPFLYLIMASLALVTTSANALRPGGSVLSFGVGLARQLLLLALFSLVLLFLLLLLLLRLSLCFSSSFSSLPLVLFFFLLFFIVA